MNRSLKITVITLVVLVVAYTAFHFFRGGGQGSKKLDDFTPRESPIEVAGGSIHICTPSGSPTQTTNGDWTASVDDPHAITFVGGKGAEPITVNADTWAIRIVNRDKEREAVLKLPARGELVHISAIDPLQLSSSKQRLTVVCDPSRPKCDKVKTVRFEINGSSYEPPCESKPGKGDGVCEVYVGKMQPAGFSCRQPEISLAK